MIIIRSDTLVKAFAIILPFLLLPAAQAQNSDVCTIITPAIFNSLGPNAVNPPYTHAGFCTAVNNWNTNNPGNEIFMGATLEVQKDELAAFFGNVLHESGDFVYPREIAPCGTNVNVSGTIYCQPSGFAGAGTYSDPYCSSAHTTSSDPDGCDCSAIQLSWNYNYIDAGAALNVDLCSEPDRVATDEVVAWGTAIWFWMTRPAYSGASTTTPHVGVIQDGDFGNTLNAINGGLECPAVSGHELSLVSRLDDYCRASTEIGVDALLTFDGCTDLGTAFQNCIDSAKVNAEATDACGNCLVWEVVPSDAPTQTPTKKPSSSPTDAPTKKPTEAPTKKPSSSPTGAPTKEPTPTFSRTEAPTKKPTNAPSGSQIKKPTEAPTMSPTKKPSDSQQPTSSPTAAPSKIPTLNPTSGPSKEPTESPTMKPTSNPTDAPTKKPTEVPTKEPTQNPVTSTDSPTNAPSMSPTKKPTASPSTSPTEGPTANPVTPIPTSSPSKSPSESPTAGPTQPPTKNPTDSPINAPTESPTSSPTVLIGCPPLWIVNSPDYEAGTLVSHPFADTSGDILGVYECRSDSINYLYCPQAGYEPGTTNSDLAWIYRGSCNSAVDFIEPTASPTQLPTLSPLYSTWEKEGCPESFDVSNPDYERGVVVERGNVVYECTSTINGRCSQEGWEPGTGQYWAEAWVILGSCSGTMAPTDIPTTNPSSKLTSSPSHAHWEKVGCPEKYVVGAAYEEGNTVEHNGIVYECKTYPNSPYCGQEFYEPGVSIYWSDAWIRLGSCAGTLSPTSSTTHVPSSAPTSKPTSPTWAQVGCPEQFDVTSTEYGAGDMVTFENHVYECKSWPISGWCAQPGYEPGVGTHWVDAWILLGSCTGTFSPTSPPTMKPTTGQPTSGQPTTPAPTKAGTSGGCADPAYSTGTAYQPGDSVSHLGGTYECKNWPMSLFCGGAGYEPGNSLYWGEAWSFNGSCGGGTLSVTSGGCADPAYSAGTIYQPRDAVSHLGSAYECKNWPMSLFCGGAGYEPGNSMHWREAWLFKGSCGGGTQSMAVMDDLPFTPESPSYHVEPHKTPEEVEGLE